MPAKKHKFSASSERKFQRWYAGVSKRLGLAADPDDPKHHYDWRAAWKAGEAPDAEGHWPSKHKTAGHPRMRVRGVPTKKSKKHE